MAEGQGSMVDGGDIHFRSPLGKIQFNSYINKLHLPLLVLYFLLLNPIQAKNSLSSPYSTSLFEITPQTLFTMGSITPNATDTFVELAKNRRTHYALSPKSPVPDSRIEQLVRDAALHVPSSFNTQSTRLVLLLHDHHKKLWDLTIGIFEGMVEAGKIPKEMWEGQTKPKLEGMKNGYGTVSLCHLI